MKNTRNNNSLLNPPEFPQDGSRVMSESRSQRIRTAVARPNAFDEAVERFMPSTMAQPEANSKVAPSKLWKVARTAGAVTLASAVAYAVPTLVMNSIGAEEKSNAEVTQADYRAAGPYVHQAAAEDLARGAQPPEISPVNDPYASEQQK